MNDITQDFPLQWDVDYPNVDHPKHRLYELLRGLIDHMMPMTRSAYKRNVNYTSCYVA